MYPLKKGKIAAQAHVGLPEGTFEEEHGRKGFYGKSAHLYHAHPPTGWTRFRRQAAAALLRSEQAGARAISTTQRRAARVSRQRRPEALRLAPLGADAVLLSQCRWRRNVFVHRGEGMIETDFGPMPFRARAITSIFPRAVTYRVVPETARQFLPDHPVEGEFEQPDKGLVGAARAVRSGRDRHARTDADALDARRMGSPHQSARTKFPRCSIRSIPWTWWAGRAI